MPIKPIFIASLSFVLIVLTCNGQNSGWGASVIHLNFSKHITHRSGAEVERYGEKGVRFLEVHLKISTTGMKKVLFNPNQFQLFGFGLLYKPILVNGKQSSPKVKIKTNKPFYYNMIFPFPDDVVPTHLINEEGHFIELGSDLDERVFYDFDHNLLESSQGAYYYHLLEQLSDSLWLVSEMLFGTDALLRESEVSALHPRIKNGITTWYHENGEIREIGKFVDDNKAGVFYTYFENGAAESKIEYFPGDSLYYHQFWNIEGDSLLNRGNGFAREVIKPGLEYEIEYINGHPFKRKRLFNDVEIEIDDQVYNIVDVPAEFPGGLNAFYQEVSEGMVYPLSARRMGIEGRVYVQFVIDTEGNVTEVETVKGIGGGCDKEAEKAISKIGQWLPAQSGGKLVKQRMVLPIIFNLPHKDPKPTIMR